MSDIKYIQHLMLLFLVGLQIFEFSNAQNCLSCGALPKLVAPPGGGTVDGAGSVVESIDAGTGCKRYDVTCNAKGFKTVVMGANQQAIQLSQASIGKKTAVLLCNNDGVIEGCNLSDGSVFVTSIYCSTT
uniref:Uncharacterized protein n=1 Tax=Panagrolaimus davidi TaxID=227884 RepID=A0A914PBV4_9BILA